MAGVGREARWASPVIALKDVFAGRPYAARIAL